MYNVPKDFTAALAFQKALDLEQEVYDKLLVLHDAGENDPAVSVLSTSPVLVALLYKRTAPQTTFVLLSKTTFKSFTKIHLKFFYLLLQGRGSCFIERARELVEHFLVSCSTNGAFENFSTLFRELQVQWEAKKSTAFRIRLSLKIRVYILKYSNCLRLRPLYILS